jgi:hypothetical protein
MKAFACLTLLLLYGPGESAKVIPVPLITNTRVEATPPSGPALVTLSNVVLSEMPGGEPGSSMRTVEFDLVNNTSNTVTAWAVAFLANRQDGQTEATEFGADGYKEYANLIPVPQSGSGVILPHGSTHSSTMLSTPVTVPVARLNASVRFAVFADGSWWGDESAVRKLFTERESRCLALYEMVTALRKARVSARGRDSLVAALSNLDAVTPGYGAGLAIVVRRNIQRALDGDPKTTGNPDDLMVHWLLQTEAEWQAADQQRRLGPRVADK